MTIEEIEYTAERKEEKEKKDEKKEEREEYSKLIKEFNKKAEELNIPYKISFTSREYAHAHLFSMQKFLWFKLPSQLNLIYYDKEENRFSFINGLDYKVFKNIEEILNKINIKFVIKLKDGKIPEKYKIVKEL